MENTHSTAAFPTILHPSSHVAILATVIQAALGRIIIETLGGLPIEGWFSVDLVCPASHVCPVAGRIGSYGWRVRGEVTSGENAHSIPGPALLKRIATAAHRALIFISESCPTV